MPSAGPVTVGAISELCHSSYQPLQRYVTHPSSLHPCAFELHLLICQLLHPQLFLCFVTSTWTGAGHHCTCKCRHVFIDRLIQQVVNRPDHQHSYQLHIDQICHRVCRFLYVGERHVGLWVKKSGNNVRNSPVKQVVYCSKNMLPPKKWVE